MRHEEIYPGPLINPPFLQYAEPGRGASAPSASPAKLVVGFVIFATSLFPPSDYALAQESRGLLGSGVSYTLSTSPQHVEWDHWLGSLAGEMDPAILLKLEAVFDEVIAPTGIYPGGMPDGDSYLLAWDLNEHHLEIQMFAEHWEWFYKNHKTGHLAGEENLETIDLANLARKLDRYARS